MKQNKNELVLNCVTQSLNEKKEEEASRYLYLLLTRERGSEERVFWFFFLVSNRVLLVPLFALFCLQSISIGWPEVGLWGKRGKPRTNISPLFKTTCRHLDSRA